MFHGEIRTGDFEISNEKIDRWAKGLESVTTNVVQLYLYTSVMIQNTRPGHPFSNSYLSLQWISIEIHTVVHFTYHTLKFWFRIVFIFSNYYCRKYVYPNFTQVRVPFSHVIPFITENHHAKILKNTKYSFRFRLVNRILYHFACDTIHYREPPYGNFENYQMFLLVQLGEWHTLPFYLWYITLQLISKLILSKTKIFL